MKSSVGQKMLKRNFILELILIGFFLLVGIGFYIESNNVSSGFEQVLGADVYPKVISIFLIICSLIALINEVRKYMVARRALDKQEESKQSVSEAKVDKDLKGDLKVYAIWVLLFFYIALLKAVGYFEMSFILLFLSMIVIGEKTKKWIIKALFISLAITLVSYVVFIKLLNVYLPSGIIL